MVKVSPAAGTLSRYHVTLAAGRPSGAVHVRLYGISATTSTRSRTVLGKGWLSETTGSSQGSERRHGVTV